MKNLFAIPRLSLFAAFTILITLVVCLAGFTGAEVVYSNYQGETENRQRDEDYPRKQSSLKGNTPYLQEPLKTRGEELLKETNFASYLKNYGREGDLDNLIKRHSDDFGESDDIDSEKENDDGYGYDDDEYYHFDFKRNEDSKETIGKVKEEPQEFMRKDGVKNQKLIQSKLPKENNPKETETIELLNFKESHPLVGEEQVQPSSAPQIVVSKSFSHDDLHKKSSDPPENLKMGDIKENLALNDKGKENRKEESGKVVGSGTVDQKPAEVKKENKAVEDKSKAKLKDSKAEIESEKADKQVSVKEGKDSVANKIIKEPVKAAEEKETHVAKAEKLNENPKLEETKDKFNSKNKEGDTVKISSEDKGGVAVSGKTGTETGNPNTVSQINSRANFVSSDYKDDPNALKTPGLKDDKKLEEGNENDKTTGLSDFRDDMSERKDNDEGSSRSSEYTNNGEDVLYNVGRGLGKTKDHFSFPITSELQNDGSGDLNKKRESWKEHAKIQHETQEHPQPPSEQPGKNQYRLNFPASELENTDYHKNYIKSLRRYKGMEDSPKVLNVDTTYNKSGAREPQKRKRSQVRKKKSMMYEESLCSLPENYRYPSDHWSIRRNARQSRNMLGNELQSYAEQQPNNFKMFNEDAEALLREERKYEQNGNYRMRRGSPQKLEYEIKIIDQNHQDGKSVTLSNSGPRRRKKDVRTKLAEPNENKNLKKYPMSQVSIDDLTKLNQKKFIEDQKTKRRISPWEQREPFGGGPVNTKSHVRVRGVPTGYYTNRVKFGQKRLSENEAGQLMEGKEFDSEAAAPSPEMDRSPLPYDQSRMQTPSESNAAQPAVKNRFSTPYINSPTNSDSSKNLIQWGWEIKNPTEFKHDPIKRFDNNNFANREYAVSPLLLVKKGWNGERISKSFSDGTNKGVSEENLDPNQIAKILAQDHDYVLLRRTDQNKFQRISGSEESGNQNSFQNPFPEKKSNTFGSIKGSSKHIENRGLNVRSDHFAGDKKFSAKFYNSEGKSGLRKTFEKLKDFAEFFRDTEQELTDNQRLENQRQSLEKKEGSDIVFSEDKLPDPIVIANEINQKMANFKTKPQNSVASITTNFKGMDQGKPDFEDVAKNMFGPESKPDYSQSNWEPALKNAFPEAKSVNSVQRNGNEIIVLDFNRNKLKSEHVNRGSPQPDPRTKGTKQSVLGPVASIPGAPYMLTGDRQVEVIINDGSVPMVLQQNPNKFLSTDRKNPYDKSNGEMGPGESLSAASPADQRAPMTIPINQLSQLPNILKTLSEKKSNNFKVLTKKNSNSEIEGSSNLNQFLKDFRDLTESNRDMSFNKKAKSMRKRNLVEGSLPSGTFSESSSSGEPNSKYLGSLLHNFVTDENSGVEGNRELPYETVSAFYKNPDGYPRSDRWYDANPSVRRQSQWTSEGRQEDYVPVALDNSELISGTMQKDAKDPLQSSESRGDEESDYQDELWQELSAASDKIQRLRREGMSKRKLRKTIEDALSFRQRRQSEKSNSFPGSKITESEKKVTADSKPADSESITSPEKLENEDGLNSVAGDSRSQKGSSDLQSEPRIEGDRKESPEPGKTFLKSDFESNLSESPESKNEKEGLIGSNESGVSRRTRRHVHRRKRSPSHDIKNKVSRTEVENTILENLAEDNYQSVYSPGIKRKLLSTEDEPEDADSYYGTDGREKGKAAGESRPQCLKNKLNKCIDPLIIELFGGEEAENEKSRDRRSLTTGFHSNYKREIDLDESMPNDFQNFLVTSLGGFGSQKREVVKKEEALWEGKETSQDNYNQIVDNSAVGKDVNEDSALEKREAPNNGNLKRGGFKGRDYYDNHLVSSSLSEAHSAKKIRSQDKSLGKINAPEFEKERSPTQIRIKITNESGKDKKSSKPIMEERDSSPTEVETPHKEKEFFDKNKLSSMRLSSPSKLHQFPKSKYLYALEVRRGERDENADRQKVYVSRRPYRRGRRNKKKFVQENPMKPMKDFSTLDPKTVESLIQKYLTDQNLFGSSTQKMPVSNHLPQVETVYNPSQGTNKAQLEEYLSSRLNLPIHKSIEKNSLKDSDASAFDEGPMRSYIKDKGTKMKEDKTVKDFEDVDWTPFSGNPRMRQENSRQGLLTVRNFKNYDGDKDGSADLNSATNSAPPHLNPYYQRQYYKLPTSGYFYHAPTAISTNSVYDTIRMRKDYPNRSQPAKDHILSKLHGKSAFVSTNSHFRQDEKERTPIRYAYDFYPNKKPFSQKYKSRDFFGAGLKSSESKSKPEFTASEHEFMKNVEEKPSMLYPMQFYNGDSSKEPDYFESVEEEYLDDESNKQESQVDDSLAANPSKKEGKAWETGLRQPMDLKSSETDETAGEEDDELDDDYEESSEEDDLDDYTLLSANQGKTKNEQGSEKFQKSIPVDDTLRSYSNSFPSTADKFEVRGYELKPTELKDGKTDDHLEAGSQKITLTENKGDADALGGTLGVLKKVNENTNIFGQNLMKSLNKFNYDETSDKLQKDKTLGESCCQELNQRKMDLGLKPKRSEEFSRESNPVFYTGKIHMRNAEPRKYYPQMKEIREENTYYKMGKRNPLDAELRGAENEFENESEENEHFINSKEEEEEEEEHNLREDEEDGGTNKRDSEDSEKVSDSKDKFEDDEKTSEDNVLENVIGKYIMRKSMKIAPEPKFKEPNMASEEMRKDFDSVSEDSKKQKSSKRSVENEMCDGYERIGKRKRLSSGHLTESNFRKYHKKNFNRKRFANVRRGTANVQIDTDTGNPNGNAKVGGSKYANDIDMEKADENEKTVDSKEGREAKRSALGLFQKFTGREKEGKRIETDEVSSPGFEPLYTDKKFQEIGRNEATLVMQRKAQDTNETPQPVFFRSPDLNTQGRYSDERKKETANEQPKERSGMDVEGDGPWRVELNRNGNDDNADKILLENKHNFQKLPPEQGKKSEPGAEGELRAYLVISKNVRTARRSQRDQLPISGAAEREVGNSYRRKSDEGAGNPDVRKRSLEASGYRLTSDREDGLRSQVPIAENRISIEEKNRALHDTQGLSEGDSKDEQPPRAQRNTEKSSSVRGDIGNIGEKFSSKRRPFKRKSVFSPRSEANIIGDGGHLNEETSEYLGQQIVGAILAHVSSDPRLRESIAPGLAIRTPACREGLHDNSKALPPSDFSDNLQSLLPKAMVGMRRKKRTRRRSCNKISKQSKQFLDFLVKGSKENDNAPQNSNENICSAVICHPKCTSKNTDNPPSPPTIAFPHKMSNPQGNSEKNPPQGNNEKNSPQGNNEKNSPQGNSEKNSPQGNSEKNSPQGNNENNLSPQSGYSQEGLANLKRRQAILLKLIEDYHHLSVLEKQNLESHYQFILQELDKTNRALDSPCEGTECGPNQGLQQNKTNCEFIKKSKGFTYATKLENVKEPAENKNSLPHSSDSGNYPPSSGPGPEYPCEGFEKTIPQDTDGFKNFAKENGTSKNNLPSYSFEPVDQKPSSASATPKPSTSEKTSSESKLDYRFPQPAKKVEDIFPRPKQLQGPFHKAPPNNVQFNDTYSVKNSSSAPSPDNKSGSEERLTAIAPETFDLLFWNSDSDSLAPVGSKSVRVKMSLPKNPRYRITEMGNPFRYGLEHFPTQFLSGFKPSELNKLGSGDAASLQLSVKNHGRWKSNLEINKIKATAGGAEEPAPPVEARSSKERLRDSSPDDIPSNLLFRAKVHPRKPVFPMKLDKKLYTKKVLPFRPLKKNENEQLPVKLTLKRFNDLGTVERKNFFPNVGIREKRTCEVERKTKTKLGDGGTSPELATGLSRLTGRRRRDHSDSQPDGRPFSKLG